MDYPSQLAFSSSAAAEGNQSHGWDLPGAPAHEANSSSQGVLEALLLNGLQGLSLADAAAARQQQPPYAENELVVPQLYTYAPQVVLQRQQQQQQLQQLGLQQQLGLEQAQLQPGRPPPQQQLMGLQLPAGSMTAAVAAASYGLQLPEPPYTQALDSPAFQVQLGQALPASPTVPLVAQAARMAQPQPQPRSRKAQQQQDLAKIRRTVYVCDIDQAVSEAELAGFFQECGAIVDCRICGDPNSTMRFAFIEFQLEVSARQALAKTGSVLGLYKLRVSPSKTAIVPVKKDFLPMSNSERELVERTIYVANIDKSVEREALHNFFSNLCGPVTKLRLLGDAHHPSKIAFIEFETATSARQALNCSGALLGALPLRISPSKTPVRLDANKVIPTGYS